MLHTIWNTLLYRPLYNTLVFLTNLVPGKDIGIALILLTVLVKIILFPLTKKSFKSQLELKKLEPELARIKKEFPNKDEQAKKTFALYKEHGVNPFSGCLVVLIQIPIIFALYFLFLKGLNFDQGTLYSFVHLPNTINTNFLGFINMRNPSWIIAILAGASQYLQMAVSMGKVTRPLPTDKHDFKSQLAYSMNVQMKYVLPLLIIVISWKISSAVALYWVVSNIVTTIQQVMIKRKFRDLTPARTV